MRRLITSVVMVAASILPSCKEEPAGPPAPATAPLPSAAAASAGVEAERARRNVGQFRIAIYYHSRPLPSFSTGVILSVPPATPPGPNSGVIGAKVVRITGEEAGRLITHLARDGWLQRAREKAYTLHSRPDAPYFRIGGSAGPDYTFTDAAEAGPEIDARLEAMAAVLEPDARDAVRDFLTTVREQPSAPDIQRESEVGEGRSKGGRSKGEQEQSG